MTCRKIYLEKFGMANIEGYNVFVPGSKMGELWKIKIEEVRLKFGFGSCVSEVKRED